MDIFSVLAMLGGLAMFIYGMQQMGHGLEKLGGGRLSSMLEKLTGSRLKGVLLGAGVTAIIQSSSATTVTIVGFVNSGIMELYQATPVIMGANIGTTMTSWLLSLTGIEGDNLILRLLKPASFTPVLALVGVALMMFSKKSRRQELGGILMGFAVLMFGMEQMSGAVKPLANEPGFTNILLMFDNPLFGLLAGTLLTAVIQSSSASVGILQALSMTGAISWGMAVPIILGQNIGTCVTALLSGIGTNKNAKRAAMVHLYFNVIGAVLMMLVYLVVRVCVGAETFAQPITIGGIAVVHTVFNVVTTLVLLPFGKQLEWLAVHTVRDAKADETVLLDDRLLGTPVFAVGRSSELAAEMAHTVKDSIADALNVVERYSDELAGRILASEDRTDHYEDVLGTFLVKLTSRGLSVDETREATRILHGIGDLERISDHAVNLLESAQEMREKRISFTGEAHAELEVLMRAIREIVATAVSAYVDENASKAKLVEPLEAVVDDMIRELKLRHVARLREGRCSVEHGFVFSDILNNLERVADHCSNLAVCVIELKQDEYNAHEYLSRATGMSEFADMYREAGKRFELPAVRAG
ncbi:MAG: Na/Pi cotransporter family protein [Candidatus Fimadaptatus sp.]